ncbi:MAG: hypothetical protein AYK22_04065 [Thermoplasmatales archaeon SG8-52-3]|nr:MAG: hypothetical protein AYK22_04065 [Thermoplasmatales archaeon SG8-52-3]
MQFNIKFRATLIAFMLIASSLSLFIISTESVNADDEEGFEELLLLITGLHPYATAGWYSYKGNESLEINGDIKFDLYLSTTISTQTKWKDDLQISIYSYNENLILPVKIKNTSINIVPELFGETVQKFNVTIEDLEYNLSYGDILIFTVEIIQSGKPIGNIIEKRYEDKLLTRAQKVADFLNKSANEDLVAFGDVIMQILGTAEEFGVTPEEFGSLGNSFSSTSFVYNSEDYPSSVTFPISSEETLKLYFHNALYEENSDTEGLVSMEEEIPNGSAFTWPTRLFSIDPYEPEINSEEWLLWFTSWLAYIQLNIVPPEEEDKTLVTYYLTGENTLSLDKPKGEAKSTFTLSSDPQQWGDIAFSRNKLIKNATAELFVYYPKVAILRKITVNASIYDDENVIASVEQKIPRTNVLELLSGGPYNPTIFEFDLSDKEIWNGHKLKLIVTTSGKPLIYPLRNAKLLCDSEDFPSSLIFKFSETDNIQINKLEDKKVIPGGSAKFELDIFSRYKEDNLKIEVTPEDPDDLTDWSIEYPKTIQIKENSSEKIFVFVNSTNNVSSAYDTDKIDLFFNVTGKTGFVSEKADVDVSDDAVDYYIDIRIPADKEIKHGTSGIYKFKITNKNTGFWNDKYKFEAISEHGWKVEIDPKTVEVQNGNTTKFNVKVFVPEDSELCFDILELNITSLESIDHDKEKIWTIRVITTVIGPNALEQLYNYFESVSEDIGLSESLGDYGAPFLLFIVLFVILLFLIILIYFLRKKYVEIVCIERIKEINPEEKAEFELNIINPTKLKQTYEINAEEVNSSSNRWEVTVDSKTINLEPRQTKSIDMTVKTTDYIKKDDWAEVKITVKPINKKKKAELSTVTTIKEANLELKILGAFSWPHYFRKGDRVNTIFRINNIGNVSANNVSIILYVNGEEKNKVEDITIPRRGYAEIEIPWIAVKGKNEVNIVVK